MSVRVSFVIVSHSEALARGVCELAAQMAPDVRFEAAGGTDDGRIGTSYDLVETAVEAALKAVDGEGSGVIVLTDLGSATMTVESVIDMSDEPERVRFVDTCLVEGAVASSVRAQLGEDLDQVADVAAALAPRMDDVPAQEALTVQCAPAGCAHGVVVRVEVGVDLPLLSGIGRQAVRVDTTRSVDLAQYGGGS